MMVVLASRAVSENDGQRILLRYDAGLFTIEAWSGNAATCLEVDPASMDQLVAEWPRIRADVAPKKGE